MSPVPNIQAELWFADDPASEPARIQLPIDQYPFRNKNICCFTVECCVLAVNQPARLLVTLRKELQALAVHQANTEAALCANSNT